MTILADSPTTTFTRIEHFNTADAEPQPGRQLELVRAAAEEFRRWFVGTGTPEWIGTFDLSTLPYPTRVGLVPPANEESRPALVGTGTPEWIGPFDLSTLPYPTRFGLFRAALSPSPFLTLTHRLMVIRWREPDGRPLLLFFAPP